MFNSSIFRSFLVLFIIVFTCLSLRAQNASAENDGWQLVRDEDGTDLYIKAGEGNARLYKAVATLNASLGEAKAHLLQFNDYVNWMYNADHVEVLGTELDGSTNLHIQTSAPGFSHKRDPVTNLIFSISNEAIIGKFTNRPTLIPEVEGFVRVASFSGFIIARQTPGDVCRFTVQYEVQMNGNVPVALMDLQMQKIVAESVKSFSREFQMARNKP